MLTSDIGASQSLDDPIIEQHRAHHERQGKDRNPSDQLNSPRPQTKNEDLRRTSPPPPRQFLILLIIIVLILLQPIHLILSFFPLFLLLLLRFPVTSRFEGRPCCIKRVGVEVGYMEEPAC